MARIGRSGTPDSVTAEQRLVALGSACRRAFVRALCTAESRDRRSLEKPLGPKTSVMLLVVRTALWTDSDHSPHALVPFSFLAPFSFTFRNMAYRAMIVLSAAPFGSAGEERVDDSVRGFCLCRQLYRETDLDLLVFGKRCCALIQVCHFRITSVSSQSLLCANASYVPCQKHSCPSS